MPSPAFQIESTMRAIQQKLIAGMPAKIAEINTEIEDEWKLEEPAPGGITLGQRSDTTFPWVAVLPSRTTKVTDTSGAIIRNHNIDVVTWVDAWQEDGIVLRVIRFVRAVDEVVLPGRMPGQSYGEGGYGLEFVEDYYGPVIGTPGESAVQTWARCRYAVRQEQYIG